MIDAIAEFIDMLIRIVIIILLSAILTTVTEIKTAYLQDLKLAQEDCSTHLLVKFEDAVEASDEHK